MANSTPHCYFPSGVLAETNVPCSSEEYTSCCHYKDICLSNALCLSTGQQPYTLSRGSCTNQKWDQGCPQYCANSNPDGGCSIVNFSFKDRVSKYCCGTAVSNDSGVTCRGGAEFTVPTGEVMLGHALLANVTSFDATPSDSSTSANESCSTVTPKTSSSSCHETAIGAGIGVSLGVIALASLAWALFERRRAKRASQAALFSSEAAPTPLKLATVFDQGSNTSDGKHHMSELDANRPVAEIMDTSRDRSTG